jgi:digeranylgeranylglycerophospholipid reductase
MPKTIIIGAGPAGLTAGKYLKDALILDQKQEIGRPVQCAEALNKDFLEEEGIKPDSAWISAVIDTAQIIVPSGKAVSIKGKEMGFILDRPCFEKFLAKKCQAEINLQMKVIDIKKEKSLWEVKTEKGKVFRSDYLIGADGPSSIVRRKVFNQKIEILPTIEYLVELEKEIDTSIMKMYFDKEKFPLGYAWVFPKSKRTANIGLGGKRQLDKNFQKLMETIVRPELGNYKLLENRSGTVPWGGAKIPLFKDNALLVGDAGGLADPITGGGIGNAMVSGRIAAECILSGHPSLYETKIKSLPTFSSELLTAQKILYSLPNPVFNQLGEVLEKKDVFYLQTIPGVFQLLSKSQLRRNFFKILKLLLIFKKNNSSLI